MNGSASGEVLMSVMSHGNGLDASVATANTRFKYFSFCFRLRCVLFARRPKLDEKRHGNG